MSDSAVICDWLDVTHSPENSPSGEVATMLLSLGAEVPSDGVYRLGEGVVRVDAKRSHTRVSASGGAIAELRSQGVWLEYLSLLASCPHRVTRLDAAYDVCCDAADVLDGLRSRYYDGFARLGRKMLKVDLWMGVREDGRETGTWYVGYRSRARATARVYDKAWERLQVAGVAIPPRVRYEITVRRDYGASLRDAAEPHRIFWHVASPALLPAPAGVEPWESGWGGEWRFVMDELLPAEVLRRRVGSSGELAALIELADRLGPNGRTYLVRLLDGRVRGHGVSPGEGDGSEPASGNQIAGAG